MVLQKLTSMFELKQAEEHDEGIVRGVNETHELFGSLFLRPGSHFALI
jgi:hypothetical protein